MNIAIITFENTVKITYSTFASDVKSEEYIFKKLCEEQGVVIEGKITHIAIYDKNGNLLDETK